MKKYDFEIKSWNKDELEYVYSPVCNEFKTFTEKEDHIHNLESDAEYGYEYISLVSKEKYRSGAEIYTECSFDKFGAPLIVFSNDISTDEGGIKRYGLHFEIVAYEDGINVWHIVPWPERTERPIKSTLIGEAHFKIEDRERIKLRVKIEGKRIIINANGVDLEVDSADIPDEFQAGITACEGINRFYSLEISCN